MRERRWFAVAAAATVAACAPRAPATTADVASVRDSAGIRIVTARERAWAPGAAWSVDPAPAVDIADTSAGGLIGVVGAVRLSDGRIAAADAATGLIHVYASDGRPLYTFGGKGKASGQFQRLWGLFLGQADTMVAFDLASATLTRFDPNGALVDTTQVAAPAGTNGLLAVAADGPRVVLASDETPVPFPGAAWSVRTDSSLVLVQGAHGTAPDTVGRFVSGEVFGLPVHGAGDTTRVLVPANRPFGRVTSYALVGDTVWVGTPAAFAATAYVHGRPVRILRVDQPVQVLGPEAIAAFRRARTAAPAGPADPVGSALTAGLDSIPFPDYLPAFGRMLADPAGALWFQGVGDSTRTWRILGRDGRWIGTVTLPEGFTIETIEPDAVLGVFGDSTMRRPRVRVYRLRRPAGGN